MASAVVKWRAYLGRDVQAPICLAKPLNNDLGYDVDNTCAPRDVLLGTLPEVMDEIRRISEQTAPAVSRRLVHQVAAQLQ